MEVRCAGTVQRSASPLVSQVGLVPQLNTWAGVSVCVCVLQSEAHLVGFVFIIALLDGTSSPPHMHVFQTHFPHTCMFAPSSSFPPCTPALLPFHHVPTGMFQEACQARRHVKPMDCMPPASICMGMGLRAVHSRLTLWSSGVFARQHVICGPHGVGASSCPRQADASSCPSMHRPCQAYHP